VSTGSISIGISPPSLDVAGLGRVPCTPAVMRSPLSCAPAVRGGISQVDGPAPVPGQGDGGDAAKAAPATTRPPRTCAAIIGTNLDARGLTDSEAPSKQVTTPEGKSNQTRAPVAQRNCGMTFRAMLSINAVIRGTSPEFNARTMCSTPTS